MMMFASITSTNYTPEQRYFYSYANLFWPLHYQKINFALKGEDEARAEE